MKNTRYILASLAVAVLLVLAGAAILFLARVHSTERAIVEEASREMASTPVAALSPRSGTRSTSPTLVARNAASVSTPWVSVHTLSPQSITSATIAAARPRQTIVFRGIVLNANNDPVGDAEVAIETLAEADRPSMRKIQKTVASGHFSFDDIPLPYLLALQVHHPDYAEFDRRYAAITDEPYAVRLFAPTSISGEIHREEKTQQAAEINVWLVEIEGAGGLQETTSLRLPLSSVQLRAGRPVRKITLAPSESAFEFRGFGPGWVKIAAEAPNGDRVESAPMQVRPGEAKTGLVLDFAARVNLSGQVVGLGEANPRTLSGVAVSLRLLSDLGEAQLKRNLRTDREGQFQFEGILPSTYEISASGEGFLSSSKVITVRGENSAQAVNLELSPFGHTLEVRAFGPGLKPLQGAQVNLFPQDSPSDAPIYRKIADDNGLCVFSDMTASVYQVYCAARLAPNEPTFTRYNVAGVGGDAEPVRVAFYFETPRRVVGEVTVAGIPLQDGELTFEDDKSTAIYPARIFSGRYDTILAPGNYRAMLTSRIFQTLDVPTVEQAQQNEEPCQRPLAFEPVAASF